MAEKKVTLSINKVDFPFKVTSDDFNRYVNELQMDDKVSPAKRFLRRALVNPEQKEALDELCDRGFAIQLAGKLQTAFQGEVEIEVKE